MSILFDSKTMIQVSQFSVASQQNSPKNAICVPNWNTSNMPNIYN